MLGCQELWGPSALSRGCRTTAKSFSCPQHPSSFSEEALTPSSIPVPRAGEQQHPRSLLWERAGKCKERSEALPVSERLQELSLSPLSKGRGDGCNHRLSAPAQGREIGSGRLGSLTDSRVTSSHRQEEKPERCRPAITCTFLTGRVTLAAATLPSTFFFTFFVIKIERGFSFSPEASALLEESIRGSAAGQSSLCNHLTALFKPGFRTGPFSPAAVWDESQPPHPLSPGGCGRPHESKHPVFGRAGAASP